MKVPSGQTHFPSFSWQRNVICWSGFGSTGNPLLADCSFANLYPHWMLSRNFSHSRDLQKCVWSLWKPSNRPKKTLVTKGTSFQRSTYGVGGKKNNTCFNPLDVFLAALTLWGFKWPHISSSKLLRLNISNFSKTILKVVFRNIQSSLVSGYHFKNNCWTPWPLGPSDISSNKTVHLSSWHCQWLQSQFLNMRILWG